MSPTYKAEGLKLSTYGNLGMRPFVFGTGTTGTFRPELMTPREMLHNWEVIAEVESVLTLVHYELGIQSNRYNLLLLEMARASDLKSEPQAWVNQRYRIIEASEDVCGPIKRNIARMGLMLARGGVKVPMPRWAQNMSDDGRPGDDRT